MDDQALVACGHCGSHNRRTEEHCFICARPLTGMEREVPDAPAVVRPPLLLSPEPAHARASQQTSEGPAVEELEAEPRQWDARRRRTAIVAAALAGVIAIGAGLWTTRDGDAVSDPFALQAAVTEEPDLVWTWDAEEPINRASPMPQGALAWLDDGAVVALDANGGERWRRDVPDLGYAVYDAGTRAVLVLSYTSAETTVTALDPETGRQRWAVPGEWATTVEEATILHAGDELRRIDPADGSEIWSVAVQGFGTLSEDGVYGFEDGKLHAWDLDGDEIWVSDAELMGSTMGTGNSVAALDGFIAATGQGSDVVGIDPETGRELWRDDPGYDGGVSSTQPGFAFSFPLFDPSSSADGADRSQETTVYDRDGAVATLSVDGHPFFNAIELEGEPHVVELGSGRIYDEDFHEVGSVPQGNTYPTLTGVYDVRDDRISYVPYGGDDPLWAIDADFSEEPTKVVPGDESLFVITGPTLSLYR